MLPLDGVRVLDFTRHLPGPYATDLLRRLGAEVIKIEPPDGDPTRWLPPIVDTYGSLFHLVNSGKKSVVVDLKTVEGRQFVQDLARHCDVVVESYRPEIARQFAIDADTLSGINPRLVYCSISGYGEHDARSGHDLNFVALAGMLDLQRDREGRPVLPSLQIGDMAGALFGAMSILAALLERNRSGSGRRIDISMSDATRAVMPTAEALYRGTHQTPASFFLTGALPAYNVYRTSDGKYLAVAPLEPKFWEVLCAGIGAPQIADRQYDEKSRDDVFSTIANAIATKTRGEWENIFADLDACVTPVLSIEEAHQRFGDPMARHPLQSNFPSPPPEKAEKLGESFEMVAPITGADEKAIARMKKSGSFDARRRLERFVMSTVLKLRQQPFFKR